MGHGVNFGSRSKWLETVLLGGTGWVSGGLAGFGALLIFDPSHSKKKFSIYFIYMMGVGGGLVGDGGARGDIVIYGVIRL